MANGSSVLQRIRRSIFGTLRAEGPKRRLKVTRILVELPIPSSASELQTIITNHNLFVQLTQLLLVLRVVSSQQEAVMQSYASGGKLDNVLAI